MKIAGGVFSLQKTADSSRTKDDENKSKLRNLGLMKRRGGIWVWFGRTVVLMDKNVHQLWIDFEAQIRREPMKAVVLAFGGGFFLCLLPVGRLLGVLIKVSLLLLKPALLILGVVKLLEYSGVTCGLDKEARPSA